MKNNLFNLNSIKKYSNSFILSPEKRVKLERSIDQIMDNLFKQTSKKRGRIELKFRDMQNVKLLEILIKTSDKL